MIINQPNTKIDRVIGKVLTKELYGAGYRRFNTQYVSEWIYQLIVVLY